MGCSWDDADIDVGVALGLFFRVVVIVFQLSGCADVAALFLLAPAVRGDDQMTFVLERVESQALPSAELEETVPEGPKSFGVSVIVCVGHHLNAGAKLIELLLVAGFVLPIKLRYRVSTVDHESDDPFHAATIERDELNVHLIFNV